MICSNCKRRNWQVEMEYDKRIRLHRCPKCQHAECVSYEYSGIGLKDFDCGSCKKLNTKC